MYIYTVQYCSFQVFSKMDAGKTVRLLSQVQAAETGFLRDHGVVFVTKCAAVKFTKPWMSRHFFEENEDPSYDGSATWPQCFNKIGEASPAGYFHRKGGSDGVITYLTWLGVESGGLSEVVENREYFEYSEGCCSRGPRHSSEEKWVWKASEWFREKCFSHIC